MEFKGTKGKWEVFKPNHIGCTNVSIGDNNGYVELWYHHFESKQEAQANAQLIASAPEMFELLKMIHLSFGGGRVITFSDKDIEDIEQLLTKITTL